MSFILIFLIGFLSVNAVGGTSGSVSKYKWTLEDVKKLADAQNPDLKAARANFDATSATILEAWSGYLPHVSVEANYQESNLPNPSAGSTSQLGVMLPYSSAVARVRQTLFDFGKTLSQIGADQALAKSAEQQALAVHNAIELSVQKAFYDVESSEHLVDVAQKGVTKFEETHRRMTVLVKTGARPSFDLSQANVELSKSKLNLISAKEALDIARINLLNIMGMPKEVTFELIDSPQAEVNIKNLDVDLLTSKALSSRPEIKKSEYGVESVMMKLHGEIRDYLPTLSLEGWYGKYLPNYPEAISDSWGGGVSLTWNIFDGLKTTSRVHEYSARLEAEGALLEKERQKIVAEVSQSYLEVVRSQSNLGVAKESLDFSKENSRLAKRRYDANVSTFLELLIADTSLLSAEAVEVQAEYQSQIALAALKKAVNAPLQ